MVTGSWPPASQKTVPWSRKMENIGETLVGDYLKVILGCDFVAFNVYTDTQGEIDVVGINAKKKEIYICEVATHLVTGLRYVNPKEKTSDNIERFVKKFTKNIEYVEKYFPNYKTKRFMLWSPIVKNQKTGAKFNQTDDITKIRAEMFKKSGVDIEVISNKDYETCLQELRDYARKETKELKSPVLRLFQIEEKLSEHLKRPS
jgi:hypothetical protein